MREIVIWSLSCLFLAVACLGVAVWAVLWGEGLTLDTLLLLALCLTGAAFFGFVFLWLAHDAGLWAWWKSRRRAAGTQESAPAGQQPAATK